MGHGHQHPFDGPEDAAFWDQMWRRRPAWRREPHGFLVRSVASLAPGTALDVGCGEGTDAIWLASAGWEVTAVDISNVALDRARTEDREQRVTWLRADLSSWLPPVDSYDLVVAQFLHVPPSERALVFEGLTRAVRAGGTLLFCAHAPPSSGTTIDRPAIADLYFTPREVVKYLSHGRWNVIVANDEPREAQTHDGPRTDLDTVVNARRVE